MATLHIPSSPADELPATPSILDDELLYDLADLFKIFGDGTRLKILFVLLAAHDGGADGVSVGTIAQQAGVSQPAVSHQLRGLRSAHLVRARRDGKTICYALADEHVETILNMGLSHLCE